MYERIRDLRKDRDWTQSHVAKLIGMSQTGYSKYEIGENNVSLEALIKLSEVYHTSVDYLLGLTNEVKPYKRVKK